MSQTQDGATKAKQTMKEKYGEDYYARIGAIGGKLGRTGGVYANPELAKKLGSKGGSLSRRGYKLTGYKDGVPQYVKKV